MGDTTIDYTLDHVVDSNCLSPDYLEGLKKEWNAPPLVLYNQCHVLVNSHDYVLVSRHLDLVKTDKIIRALIRLRFYSAIRSLIYFIRLFLFQLHH